MDVATAALAFRVGGKTSVAATLLTANALNDERLVRQPNGRRLGHERAAVEMPQERGEGRICEHVAVKGNVAALPHLLVPAAHAESGPRHEVHVDGHAVFKRRVR